MLSWFAALMTGAGAGLAALAVYVAWRRGAVAGLSLAALLVSVGWWGLAYAVELTVTDLGDKTVWGDLKYLGICGLAPAWLVFVLQYTGQGHLVTRRLLLALAVEPVALLGVLTVPATHDLVRYYPASAAGDALPVVGTGPVFWVHLVYTNAVVLAATIVFVATMLRMASVYRRMTAVLVVAAILPWAANLLHNFQVGWFARLDLTPFAFVVTGAVLVWGLYREGMVNLSPLARSMIMQTMGDGVFVVDDFGRIADVNAAGASLLGLTQGELVGRDLDEVVRSVGAMGLRSGPAPGVIAATELEIGEGAAAVSFDVSHQALTDHRGRVAGQLIVLRDVTERVRTRDRLEQLVAERTRVAQALQTSLTPGELPDIPGVEVASRFHPAGDGSEIGGDFFDVFSLGRDRWGLVLGDVSGKGAEAAAVTALARYTLRTLADPDEAPSRTLGRLNARLLAQTDEERFCTLVYGLVRPAGHALELTLCLAGHHPPLLVRANGAIEEVGALGTALGLFERPDLADSVVRVEPGDVLCAFTDGLVEARRQGELFGVERGVTLLRTHSAEPLVQLADELVEAAREFHLSTQLSDDLAILLLRVRSRRP